MASTKTREFADALDERWDSLIAADRWNTLSIGVGAGSAEPTNSDLITTWMESTREVLGRMIHGVEGNDEYSLLCEAEDKLLEQLGSAATDLAETVLALRAAKKAGKVA